MMLKQLQEQSRWLSRQASNVTSQCGEDGIIASALSRLPERTSWCVEFRSLGTENSTAIPAT